MTERPILFSAPMVRAILAGTKTQTRRVLAPRCLGFIDCCCGGAAAQWVADGDRWHCGTCGGGARLTPRDVEYVRCPYGQPGDRLWVRETFAEGIHQMADVNHWVYAADRFGEQQRLGDRWKPSIHMPRAASRITLEITGVRVERLQAISEADAIAEGARHFPDLPIGPLTPTTRFSTPARWSMESPASTDQCLVTARYAFGNLIDKINGAGTWDSNPLVWVVEFRRVPSPA